MGSERSGVGVCERKCVLRGALVGGGTLDEPEGGVGGLQGDGEVGYREGVVACCEGGLAGDAVFRCHGGLSCDVVDM